jgi:hypothetical protein
MKKAALAVLLFITICIVALLLLVQPDRELNLQYSKVPWGDRVRSAVLNLGVMTLTEEDASNLFKESITKNPKLKNLPIAGAAIDLEQDALVGRMNLKKGFLTVGVQMNANVRLAGNRLEIVPTGYKLGRIPVSAETFHNMLAVFNVDVKQPFSVNLSDYIPQEVAVTGVKVQTDSLKMTLIPKLISR